MHGRFYKTIAGLVVALAFAILCASVEAKLGLYYPEHSASGITSKVIKLRECRMERVAAELSFEPVDFSLPSPLEPESYPPQPQRLAAYRLVVPRCHWFRPPPFLS